ncbi:hypothetical protein [Jejuia spongiicola]|uniref:Uncharacterized protein n=1 Tax=Jejuia spongiicola TaxID=2942207 RepID=A0ABT0QC00_9FLAO|nr:hypothetical protein [Jejuia spongiicola]MCL6294502.1 hypothetical protein [Jejuia spongiicola]
MKYIFYLIILSVFFSCGKEKTILLPEINHSNISEIKDVSPAYLFYDETKTDSVELNRKNLISTTNWLVNVDKRLTLKQAIPHIKFLQEKKKNSSHKNENAKNYFTCNDTSKKSLGFIEFTDVIFHEESSEEYISKISDLKYSENIKPISINLKGEISILNSNSKPFIIKSTKETILNDLKKLDSGKNIIFLNFNEGLFFQDYITYKSLLLKADLQYATLSNQEFLHN